MRHIEPINYRKGSEIKIGSLLEARIISDDLKANCTFYWAVKSYNISPTGSEYLNPSSEILDEGNLYMGGENYLNWSGDNDSAYNFIAESLNLTLIEETQEEDLSSLES
jgi:hypothetical protein